MIGTTVNFVSVFIGGIIGTFAGRAIPERLTKAIMTGLALVVLYIGISGSLDGKNTLVVIVSMVIGTIIGEMLDLDEKINILGNKIENKFTTKGKNTSIARGFVNASLLFCVGAMAVVGSLDEALTGDSSTILSKALIDGIAAIVMSSALGIGVSLSAVMVFLYQGAITMLASFISPFLTNTVIADMTCTGSLLIIAVALNMLGITKIKVMNFVPAMFVPIIIYLFI